MTTKTTTTTAERVAALLGDNGQTWDAADGRTWSELTAEAGRSPCPDDPDLVRYEWADGSALVAAPGGWDLAAGPGCWCWAGVGHVECSAASQPAE